MREQKITIDRAPNGELLGASVFLNASEIESYINGDEKTVKIGTKITATGLIIEFGYNTPIFRDFAENAIEKTGKDTLEKWAKAKDESGLNSVLKEWSINVLKVTSCANQKKKVKQ